MNQELSNKDRKNLRKLAHTLKPIVMIGQHGVTAAVVSEIDMALISHELIKIRVRGFEREERQAKVEEIAKPEFKARMAVRLAVAGAFHTDFMKPAVEKLEKQLAETPITATRIPVISNVDMQPHTDADSIRKTLATQVTNPCLKKFWILNYQQLIMLWQGIRTLR